MFQNTKYLAGTIALLLGSTLFAMVDDLTEDHVAPSPLGGTHNTDNPTTENFDQKKATLSTQIETSIESLIELISGTQQSNLDSSPVKSFSEYLFTFESYLVKLTNIDNQEELSALEELVKSTAQELTLPITEFEKSLRDRLDMVDTRQIKGLEKTKLLLETHIKLKGAKFNTPEEAIRWYIDELVAEVKTVLGQVKLTQQNILEIETITAQFYNVSSYLQDALNDIQLRNKSVAPSVAAAAENSWDASSHHLLADTALSEFRETIKLLLINARTPKAKREVSDLLADVAPSDADGEFTQFKEENGAPSSSALGSSAEVMQPDLTQLTDALSAQRINGVEAPAPASSDA